MFLHVSEYAEVSKKRETLGMNPRTPLRPVQDSKNLREDLQSSSKGAWVDLVLLLEKLKRVVCSLTVLTRWSLRLGFPRRRPVVPWRLHGRLWSERKKSCKAGWGKERKTMKKKLCVGWWWPFVWGLWPFSFDKFGRAHKLILLNYQLFFLQDFRDF